MKKFDFCEKCRFKDHSGFALGSPGAEGGCDLLIIMDYPMQLDCKKGKPAHDDSRALRSLVGRNVRGIRVEKQFALGCVPYISNGKGEYDTGDVKRCAKRLKAYIKLARPKVILALGGESFHALGLKGRMKDVRGRIFDVGIDGHQVEVVVSNGIRAVNKNPGLYWLLERDLDKALQLCRGGFERSNMELEVVTGYDDVIGGLKAARDSVEARAEETGKNEVVVFDLETTSLDHYKEEERVIGVSLSWKMNHALAFLLDHKDASYTEGEREDILKKLEGLLCHKNVTTCAANAKFDYSWLHYRYGMDIQFPDFDVLLVEHMLEEDKKGNYNLKQLVTDYVPAFGGYEGALGDELEAIKSRFREQYLESKSQMVEAYLERWLGFSVQERRRLLIEWVEQGYLPATDIDKFSEVKITKCLGRKTVSKQYMAAVGKMVGKIPAAELGIELPAEQGVTYEDVPVKTMLEYAALDAALTREVFKQQFDRMKEEYERDRLLRKYGEAQPLLNVYMSHTVPMSQPIAEIEHKGIRVDREKAEEALSQFDGWIFNYEQKLHEEAGHPFNVNSSAALQTVIFDEMGFKAVKKTDKGSPSLNEEALVEMYDEHDTAFFKNLVSHRKICKVRNTFVKKWADLSGYDGMLRYSLHQNGTATYRLSSSDPGMQNVPAFLDEEGFNLKALFLPDSEEFDLYDLDISNAELRVLCAYSEDDALIEAFNNGKDIHCLTGAGITPYLYEDLVAHKEDKTSDQHKVRQLSKAVNFGVIYMMGAKGLSNTLWSKQRMVVSEGEAQNYLDLFFGKYPGVKIYISYTKYLVEKYGFVETYTGRKRRFPLACHSRRNVLKAYRQAVNFRIQSTAADMINANLVDLQDRIRPLGGRVLLTVHDSILFQLPKGTTEVRPLLDEVILDGTKERFPWLPVPWKYDVGRGPNYGECTEAV